MSFLPKTESLSVKESSEQQLDSAKQWVDRIELPDDSKAWQNSIELPEDMSSRAATPTETCESDRSRFEEGRQIERLAQYLNNMPEIKRENWLNLSFEDRVNVVQRIENQAAKIGCRPALTVESAPMNKNERGGMNWGSQKIVINESLLRSNKPEDFQQTIKTLLHEGRHAYQYSNISLERTEPNDEKYQAWVMNLVEGYHVAKLFGHKNYYLQPLEVDARVFSEAVVSKLKI